eukprot:9414142-Lingulodinium_polyedra.AAC.1
MKMAPAGADASSAGAANCCPRLATTSLATAFFRLASNRSSSLTTLARSLVAFATAGAAL